jgi:hypothetical protein
VEICGEFSEIGQVDFKGMTTRETWGKNKGALQVGCMPV